MFTWKPTGRIRRSAARSTTSAIAPGPPGRRKSPLLLSTKFSAQSKPNYFFGFLLAVADERDTTSSLFSEGI